MAKRTRINGKVYTVQHVFNMVGNWYFTDKHGTDYLVDGEDVSAWADERKLEWRGVDTAIAYAKELAGDNNGVFYWKIV